MKKEDFFQGKTDNKKCISTCHLLDHTNFPKNKVFILAIKKVLPESHLTN